VLYPHVSSSGRLDVLHEQMVALSLGAGLEVLDLAPLLSEFRNSPETRMASRYDNHPSALVHERMAREIHAWLMARWPEIATAEHHSEGKQPL
jgi:hypothetical protein